MRIIFAGGSTGGHLMTGLSLAGEIKTLYPESEIIFFATSKSFERQCISEKGFLLKRLRYTTGWKRRSSGNRFEVKSRVDCLTSIYYKLRFFSGIIIDTAYCWIVTKRFGPDIIVGLGGYSSAPPLIAAIISRSPFVVIEQNLIPGRVNRLFSRWAKEVYCHFHGSLKWFAATRLAIVTGNPIRKDILSFKRDAAARRLGLSAEKKTLLIIGGSQGARAINETIMDCLPELEKFSNNLQIIHCTGDPDYEMVKAAYKQSDIESHVCSFMSNIGLAYTMADLVVSRAGAGTISETTALGLPSILIPYPYAAEDHQFYNAKELADQGAAYLVRQEDFTVNNALKMITGLLKDEKRLAEMRMASRGMGRPDAVNVILERIKGLIGI